ncbi:hypothetical protein ASN_788 [Acetobacter senegalensis]|uniref:Uncharacterized protein n=1 Tax=Acetobacter senegalensis TaxID=446692 RepID=A0A0U5ES11_9PROT|nr:hypothetical protein [Acetobacter senegalensis]CEF40191.1 hypothetical protein ASN_788 [Acetobacter senegalensis]
MVEQAGTVSLETFYKRKISLTFRLGRGQFGTSGSQELHVSGHRIQATVNMVGGVAGSSAELRVYGLTQSLMNDLNQPVLTPNADGGRNNTIIITAGNEGGPLTQIFQGNIVSAWQDNSGAPDTCLNVYSTAMAFSSLADYPSSSYKGTISIADAVGTIVRSLGFIFENDGVTARAADVVLTGSSAQQLDELARMGRFQRIFDNGTYVIWPEGKGRSNLISDVSPATGMLGYPSFTGNGLNFKTVFRPEIRFGQAVKVTSDLMPACGVWNIKTVTHDIESENPGGEWLTSIETTRPLYGDDNTPPGASA